MRRGTAPRLGSGAAKSLAPARRLGRAFPPRPLALPRPPFPRRVALRRLGPGPPPRSRAVGHLPRSRRGCAAAAARFGVRRGTPHSWGCEGAGGQRLTPAHPASRGCVACSALTGGGICRLPAVCRWGWAGAVQSLRRAARLLGAARLPAAAPHLRAAAAGRPTLALATAQRAARVRADARRSTIWILLTGRRENEHMSATPSRDTTVHT